MSTQQQTRQPSGAPDASGGRFAAATHPEAVIALSDDTEDLTCLGHENPDDCTGPVELRESLSGTGESYPRCDGAWQDRLEQQRGLDERYPVHAPSDWSATDCGEAWGEDDY
jgi:hypothetical protein